MLDKTAVTAEQAARAWMDSFGAALAARDAVALAGQFVADSHWRNLCGLSWQMITFSSADMIAAELVRRSAEVEARGFAIDSATVAPRHAVVAGQAVIEALFRFESANGPALGVVRLLPSPDGALRAWTLSTLLDIDAIAEARRPSDMEESHARDFVRNWLDERHTEIAFADRDPQVLIVGGGHAGLSAAVELKRLGIDTLVIDKMKRVGDNWRLRYHGLKLHNKTAVNHLRYMPFPAIWPAYIAKDKIANWLETYVETMEINFWTETSFDGADYDEATQSWNARIRGADGATRTLRPKHIIMATSVSGTPNIPSIPTLDNFAGPVMHSSRFNGAADWAGRSVLVMGSGTSAHDICQELHANGAKPTMVQRSPTLVVNVDPSAQLYETAYFGDGPPLEVRDVFTVSVPLAVMKVSHKLVTDKIRQIDAPLLQRLEAVGFRLEFGENGTGWPLKYRTRGGGYYFNVGCSDLIADRKVGLIQAADIKSFVRDGVQLQDGATLQADAVILATGYKGQDHIVASLFGAEVADRVGPIWNFDAQTQELRNMWTRTGQPGLWFTGGAFSQCRMFSRYIALQIDAIEQGRLAKAA